MGRTEQSQSNAHGVSLAGAASVVAVVAVLVLVSLPRLSAFAVEENEGDAAALTRSLAAALADEAEGPGGAAVALADLVHALGMEPRADDMEWLEGGRLMRRHGYLFELATPRSGEGPLLRAWPWAFGKSGRAAFVGEPGGAVRRHANAEGGWSGLGCPPAAGCAGWDSLDGVELASW